MVGQWAWDASPLMRLTCGMPRHRPPREVWEALRLIVLARDGWRCVRCGVTIHDGDPHDGTSAQVDHIQSGKLATNAVSNLRSLCRRCHVLRACNRHRGMMSRALEDGVIEANWRPLVWDDHPP